MYSGTVMETVVSCIIVSVTYYIFCFLQDEHSVMERHTISFTRIA